MSGTETDTAVRSGLYDWLAEAALASLTVVAAISMSRVFIDSAFLRDAVTMALASHLVAAAARRTRLNVLATFLLSGLCLVVAATVLLYRATAWLVFPTQDTFRAAWDHLAEGWNVAGASPAPVEAVPGLVLMVGAGLWVCALLADTVAFRMRATVPAVLPASALFGFTAVAGTDDGRILYAALYCGAAAAVLVATRLRTRLADLWIEASPGRGTGAMARIGALMASVAVLAGAAFGPLLPGAGAEPWVDVEGLQTDDSYRVVVSPLVQVQSRLVQNSERQMFTVAVPRASLQYWRLMSLDEFDGSQWRARSRFEEAVGLLPATLDQSAAGPSITQTVSLSGLDGVYLPVAHELRRVVDDGGVGMEYEAASGALVKTRLASIEGPSRFTYTVESVVPGIGDPDALRGASTAALKSDFLDFNTDLPDEVAELVRAEAERVTAGSRSDYQRALQLQDYFWVGGRFTYDLDVNQSRTIDDLGEFLFEARAGYCEQFASAYAAMARSVGLPARVAVGFTWGEWDERRDVFVVRGEHAHAWPEVYFAGTGWVRFEPTPGRGAPGDFSVTGRVAAQAGAGVESGIATGADAESEFASDSTADDVASGSGVVRQRSPADPESSPADGVTRFGEASGRSVPGSVLLVAVGLALAASLVAAGVPALRYLLRRWRRRRLAGDPAGLVELAWNEALEALQLLSLGPHPSETHVELARRVVAVQPSVGPLKELADLATHGCYASGTPAPMALRAGIVASRVADACRRQAGPGRRLAAALDPATLLTRRPRG